MSASELLKRANRLKRAGKLDEAIRLYHQVIEIDRNFTWAYYSLGDALVEQGNLDEAISCYYESLRINPNSAWLFYRLGQALTKLGDLEAAVEYLQKAVQLKPDFYKFYETLNETIVQTNIAVNNSDQDRKKILVDLGCGLNKPYGYIGVDKLPGQGIDVVADLTQEFPFLDNSVDKIRAYDCIEHLPVPIHTMNEIWRICKPHAEVDILVPSTDGRGAFQDPTHVSFWNLHSFFYYCSDYPEHIQLCHRYGFNGVFKIKKLENIDRGNNIVYVEANLIVLKVLKVVLSLENKTSKDIKKKRILSYKPEVEILDVKIFFENDPILLSGFNIEFPVKSSTVHEYQIPVSGWVVGNRSPVVAVEVMNDSIVLQQVSINQSRPDVSKIYSDNPSALQSGFITKVDIDKMPLEAELVIEAVFADLKRVALGKIKFKKKFDQNDYSTTRIH